VEDQGKSVGGLTDAEREPYLRAALLAFENGSIDMDEYTRRVQAIDRAGSRAEMTKALGKPASARPAVETGAQAVETEAQAVEPEAQEVSRPRLDAVDLARMMAPAPGVRSRAKSSRYTVLIMVALLLVVLLGIGIWLASRVHNANSNSGGAVVRPALAVQASPAAGPPSALSSRR